jgi:hypothetical protein
MNTLHAGAKLSAAETIYHYEHTGTVGAYVSAGRDRFGIWVAGAAHPNADLTSLKAAPVSGDWRTIGGKLELVGVLSVNVPGFPVPRKLALVASGMVQSLVASGSLETDKRAETMTSSGKLQAAVARRKARQLAARVGIKFAYNPNQWRVPRGNERGGQWIDMPGVSLDALEAILMDSADNGGIDEGVAGSIGESLDRAIESAGAAGVSLKDLDGDSAKRYATEADEALSELEAKLQDGIDTGAINGPDVERIGKALEDARESVAVVKDSDLSLLGDEGIGDDDVTDIGGGELDLPGGKKAVGKDAGDIGGEDTSIVGDIPEGGGDKPATVPESGYKVGDEIDINDDSWTKAQSLPPGSQITSNDGEFISTYTKNEDGSWGIESTLGDIDGETIPAQPTPDEQAMFDGGGMYEPGDVDMKVSRVGDGGESDGGKPAAVPEGGYQVGDSIDINDDAWTKAQSLPPGSKITSNDGEFISTYTKNEDGSWDIESSLADIDGETIPANPTPEEQAMFDGGGMYEPGDVDMTVERVGGGDGGGGGGGERVDPDDLPMATNDALGLDGTEVITKSEKWPGMYEVRSEDGDLFAVADDKGRTAGSTSGGGFAIYEPDGEVSANYGSLEEAADALSRGGTSESGLPYVDPDDLPMATKDALGLDGTEIITESDKWPGMYEVRSEDGDLFAIADDTGRTAGDTSGGRFVVYEPDGSTSDESYDTLEEAADAMSGGGGSGDGEAPEAGLPAGWSEDDKAPSPTFYNETGTVGITQTDDGKWHPLHAEGDGGDVQPTEGTWDDMGEGYDTQQEAFEAAMVGEDSGDLPEVPESQDSKDRENYWKGLGPNLPEGSRDEARKEFDRVLDEGGTIDEAMTAARGVGEVDTRLQDSQQREGYWEGLKSQLPEDTHGEAREAFDKVLDDGGSIDEALQAGREASIAKTDSRMSGGTLAGNGSAQQKAATKSGETLVGLQGTLSDAASNGGLSEEDSLQAEEALGTFGKALDALTEGIQEGAYNADHLKAAQAELSRLEAVLMSVAEKPGLDDDHANKIGTRLDEMFVDLGNLAQLLQGSTEAPPFAARKYTRQWLGRRGIKLGGHSLISI